MIPWYNDSFLFSFERENNYGTNTTFYGYYNNSEFDNPIIGEGHPHIHITHPEYLYIDDLNYIHPFDYDNIITGGRAGNYYRIEIGELKKVNYPDFLDFEYYDWEWQYVDLKHEIALKDKCNIKILEKDYKNIKNTWKMQ